MKHEGSGDTNFNWYTQNNRLRLVKRTGRFRNLKTSGDHPDNSIIKISHDTENSPGDSRRHAVTQTLKKDHHLALVGKTFTCKLLLQEAILTIDNSTAFSAGLKTR